MIREVDWREISDGRLYTASDMVRTDTGGCVNCGKCCHGMRDTIVLDPCDICSLHRQQGYDFTTLMEEGRIELGICDGMILPHLCMTGAGDACTFLDEQGRCTIHTCRPGFCRLYPLGRYYHDDTFSYILQVGECVKPNLTKIRIRKWLGIQNLTAYENYIRSWHYFLRSVQEEITRRESEGEDNVRKECCMYILQQFYVTPYEEDRDFYEIFGQRLEDARLTLL